MIDEFRINLVKNINSTKHCDWYDDDVKEKIMQQ
jgi:hypothetical protein